MSWLVIFICFLAAQVQLQGGEVPRCQHSASSLLCMNSNGAHRVQFESSGCAWNVLSTIELAVSVRTCLPCCLHDFPLWWRHWRTHCLKNCGAPADVRIWVKLRLCPKDYDEDHNKHSKDTLRLLPTRGFKSNLLTTSVSWLRNMLEATFFKRYMSFLTKTRWLEMRWCTIGRGVQWSDRWIHR